MLHGRGYAACTWTCSMMDMQHGHGHAERTWTRSVDMDRFMQHLQCKAMNHGNGQKHRHGHEEWAWT
jgi:hypothetical protein